MIDVLSGGKREGSAFRGKKDGAAGWSRNDALRWRRNGNETEALVHFPSGRSLFLLVLIFLELPHVAAPLACVPGDAPLFTDILRNIGPVHSEGKRYKAVVNTGQPENDEDEYG